MIRDGRISAADVHRYSEIQKLEERLQALRSGGTAAPLWRARRAAAPATAPARSGRRRRTAITAEQLASRQLQGRYLGLIRQIPASQRGRYTKTAKERGREAAIREMQVVLKK
ncbi:MAG TPA: hypothetical protein VKH35_14665 [Thermoanaerobaculia bacterium]|nr:hypothetical protein [Thermoanaerobaculia bacterium]